MAFKEVIVPALKYGGTFLVGLFAGGIMMQRAIQKAMQKNAQNMMGNLDPQAMQAMMAQLQGGGNIDPQLMQNVAGQMGNMQGLDVTVPGMNVAQAPQVNVPVRRTPAAPLNITASQLGSGSLRV